VFEVLLLEKFINSAFSLFFFEVEGHVPLPSADEIFSAFHFLSALSFDQALFTVFVVETVSAIEVLFLAFEILFVQNTTEVVLLSGKLNFSLSLQQHSVFLSQKEGTMSF
jgi:hypothetical protein